MSNLTAELCAEGDDVAHSMGLRIAQSTKLLMALIGAFLVINLQRKEGSSWIPNPNAKLLYRIHIGLAFEVAFTFVLVYSAELIRLGIPHPNNSCAYVINAQLACAIRLIPVFGIVSQSFNMLAFAFERLISTLFPVRYEKWQNCYLAIFLCILAFAGSISIVYFFHFSPISDDSFITAISVKNPQNRVLFDLAVHIQIAVETTTLLLFSLTYYLNYRKRQSQLKKGASKLGARYQVSENQKVISVLVPCFVVHCFLNTGTLIGLAVYSKFFPISDPISLAIWIEVFGQSQNYGLIMPIILFFRMRPARGKKVGNFDAQTATDRHFEALRKIFN